MAEKKIVLITGASSGIGKALIDLLENDSDRYELIALARNEVKLRRGKFYFCDLQNHEEVLQTAALISEDYPTIDVLVNNAGVGFPTQLHELSVDEYDEIMDTNVKGLVFLTREILKLMLARDAGQIINVSSPAGVQSNPVAPIYCASKFALEGYTAGLRMQLREQKKNIRVTLVRPGGVDTNYWRERKVDRSKFMTPKEMAEVLKFVLDFPAQSNVVDITLESLR